MKTSKILLLAAILPILAISCAKTEVDAVDGHVPSEPGNPAIDESADLITITLEAGVENAAPTRTSISDGAGAGEKVVSWSNGEVIDVLNGAVGYETSEAAVSAGKAYFEITVAGGTEQVYLAYPQGKATLEGSTVSLTIPSNQDGDFAKANFLLAKAPVVGDEVGGITFQHACSYFKIVVSDASVKKAVITGNNGEALAGTVPYTFNGAGEVTPGDVSSPATSITVTFNGTGDYYVAALPNLNLTNGVTIKFYRDADAPAGGNRTESALGVGRSNIESFGDNDAICSRYVSTSATGSDNGRTPAKAWSLAQLKNFLSGSLIAEDKLVAMDGVTIHLEEGATFTPSATLNSTNLGDESHKLLNLTIDGGAGATLSGDNARSIFCQTNSATREGTNVVFKNITFDGGYRSSGSGGAGYFGRGTVKFDGCTFSGNHSGEKGGALHVYGSAARVILNNCTFTGNYTANNGGALHIESTVIAEVTGCSFDGNYTTGTGSTDGGGAINVGGTTSKIYLNKCLFKDNYSNVGAALTNYAKGSEIYMNACAFTGNHITRTYGVVIALRGGTDVTASLFMNNITMADDQWTDSGNSQQSCWINLNGLTKFVLSNSSLIGQPRQTSSKTAIGADGYNPNLLRFDGAKGDGENYHWLINNIIAITAEDTEHTYYSCDLQGSYVKSYCNKLTALKSSGNFSKDGNGTGTNFWGNTTSFAGLAYSNPATPTWDNCYWSRSGGSDTTGTDGNVDKVSLSNIKTKINNAHSGFYNWLNSIGALDVDGRYNPRTSYSWPGAYNK